MLRIITIIVLWVLILAGIAILGFYAYYGIAANRAKASLGAEAPILEANGIQYRDLNKNGVMDQYENPDAPVMERVRDVLSQMSLEEKAGMMFINMIGMLPDGSPQERPMPSNPLTFMIPTNSEMIVRRHMNHFNIMQSHDPAAMAIWYNSVQNLAERTRLGIPITIASDPRHSFPSSQAAAMFAGDFSVWPEPLGLAATRDTLLVEEFGNIARQEYLAVGIRLALHPMLDLATEPRWSRIYGTFGEDADLSASMGRAYIHGLQGDSIGTESVATMSKHFPGGGPQDDGWEAHFSYGKDQVYPGNKFDLHVSPFVEGAMAANTAQIMVSYAVGVGITEDGVGFAFSPSIVTDLLRTELGFKGVISTDWAVLSSKRLLGFTILESPGWGVEDLAPIDRAEKALAAGVDLFGGESNPEWIVELVNSGRVQEARIDSSVGRLLRDKFLLGLFDDPYVDENAADKIVGSAPFVEAGRIAQQKSIVLLKNMEKDGSSVLPLGPDERIFVQNVDSSVASRYATVVSNPAEATVALLRVYAPYEPPRGRGMLEGLFHQGDLDFKGEELDEILSITRSLPTIVDIYLDRPAVIPEIAESAAAVLGNFGASDEVILDAVFGRFDPSGRLPFELPSSMDAVRAQLEDVPHDSKDPIFPYGFGLSYSRTDTVGSIQITQLPDSVQF
ncbi:MAG: glycoside hydrolase family 3 C-terminal domain-containing protein [Bacteroidetes bacterium]|nr:glycoside hydrolase family 3 C-terminal domain-containing protein [Bacteroidota bacterium]